MAARQWQLKQLLPALCVLLLIVIFLSARHSSHYDDTGGKDTSIPWSNNEEAIGDKVGNGASSEADAPSQEPVAQYEEFEGGRLLPNLSTDDNEVEPGNDWYGDGDDGHDAGYDQSDVEENTEVPDDELQDDSNDDTTGAEEDENEEDDRIDYREIFSLTTRDRKYFTIYFDGIETFNPNLIPHPTEHDKWIAIARRGWDTEKANEQLVCMVSFLGESLVCSEHPTILPAAPSLEGVCIGEMAWYQGCELCKGPRDARVFWGPGAPYILYGSQSSYTCLGIWLQDARMLLEPFALERVAANGFFPEATEVMRPPPFKAQEKNFFLFWDTNGTQYVHYDIKPSRVFAQLNADGTVGENLAPYAEDDDQVCLAKYLPHIGPPPNESLHQATNSLSVTLCKRNDPDCIPDDSNTFIMHLFHHKSKDGHSVYEPYVMLFQRNAPFAVHAISQRPLWIHGRPRPGEDGASFWDFLFMTSISWKTHGQKYHGYIDDPLFLAFGVTDKQTAAIDILAGDLLQDLAFC